MYHRDFTQKADRDTSPTSPGLLLGSVSRRDNRTTDQNSKIKQFIRRNQHITPYRKRLGWLRTDSRRSYFAAILMYKITKMREPGYLGAFFTEHKPKATSRGPQPEPKIRPPPRSPVIAPFKCRARGLGTFFLSLCAIYHH